MKLSLNLSSISKRLRTNVSLVLWLCLLVILLLSAWVIKGQVDTVLGAKKVESFVLTKLPRINFGIYDGIEKQFNDNNQFEPAAVTEASPFGLLTTIEQPNQ